MNNFETISATPFPNNGYFISTGALSAMYTLRQRYTERHWYNTPAGPESQIREHEYHVVNLSTDPQAAMEKAKGHTGYDLLVDFDIHPNREKNKVDWDVLKFGKYTGVSLRELFKTEPNYVLWVAMWKGPEKYMGNVKAAAAIVGQDVIDAKIASDEGREVAYEARKADRQKAIDAAKARSEWIGRVKDRVIIEVKCCKVIKVECSDYVTGRPTINKLHLLEDVDGNHLKWFYSGYKVRMDEGCSYVIGYTVKSHDMYQGGKQTAIQRVAIQRVVD